MLFFGQKNHHFHNNIFTFSFSLFSIKEKKRKKTFCNTCGRSVEIVTRDSSSEKKGKKGSIKGVTVFVANKLITSSTIIISVA